MPNHVVNELIFRDVNVRQQEQILLLACGTGDFIDFEKLLPPPINSWRGSVSKAHKETFPYNDLNWCRDNWGTKWNAYGKDSHYTSILQKSDILVLTFQTAWGPPYGWICALFNSYQGKFEHNWMSEGSSTAYISTYDYAELEGFGIKAWDEQEADEGMQRHLHKLLWGVEEFAE